MAEKYKEFDLETPSSSSGGCKSGHITKREVVLVVIALICIVVIIVLAVLLANSKSGGSDETNPTSNQSQHCPMDTSCNTPGCLRAASHVMELVNKTAAKPCDDFYTFACSNYHRLHPLSPDKSEVTTVGMIEKQNVERMRRLVEAIPSTDDPDHYEVKAKSLYQSCLNHFQHMDLGGTPLLNNVIEPSGGWWLLLGDQNWPPSNYSFQNQLQKVHVDFWTNAFFEFAMYTDWLDWNKKTIDIELGGLGMKYYYYKYPRYVAGYRQYMEKVAQLLVRDAKLQVSDDEKNRRLDTFVEDVLFVEKELAEVKDDAMYEFSRVKLSDLNKNSTGVLDWIGFFQYMFNTNGETLVTGDTYVGLDSPEYVQNFITWIRDLNPSNKTRILNNFMVWAVVNAHVPYLSWEYTHLYWEARINRSGALEIPPAWQDCMFQLDNAMSEAMGALFIQNHFIDQNRDTAHNITDYVKKALLESLSSSQHWMSNASRQTARQKLQESLFKLGYPDYMLNETTLNKMYESLHIDPDNYFSSMLSVREMYRQNWVERFRNPNDRSVWVYPVYEVIVEYYHPWKELFIPAGILQYPIFDHSSPRFMNFGSLGTLVGRELTNAIDVVGSEFLLNGSYYGDWWSNATKTRYIEVRQCLIDSYDQYTMGPFPSLGFDSKMTVSPRYSVSAFRESTGIKLAYKAYQEWMKDTGGEKEMPGHDFTNDQMFFISYAQSICSNRRPIVDLSASLSNGVTNKIRVNGALAQVPEFQDAFQCPADSKMVAEKRCSLY